MWRSVLWGILVGSGILLRAWFSGDVLVGFLTSTQTGASSAEAHVDRARAQAGAQWASATDFFCGPGKGNRPDDPLLEPTKIFDNLYAVGRTGTVIYAITTSVGLVVIDTGFPGQTDSVLLAGFKALALDPANIRFVFVTHGHGDHYGGAAYLQQRYGARIVASAADWSLMEQPAVSRGSTAPLVAPKRDIVAVDGEAISVGGTNVVPVLIPGHTSGALALIFPVEDGQRSHTAGLFGGTILTAAGVSDAALLEYVESIGRYRSIARRMGVTVHLQNHPLMDGMSERMMRLKTRTPGSVHPFVVGTPAYLDLLDVMSECAMAEVARRNGASK